MLFALILLPGCATLPFSHKNSFQRKLSAVTAVEFEEGKAISGKSIVTADPYLRNLKRQLIAQKMADDVAAIIGIMDKEAAKGNSIQDLLKSALKTNGALYSLSEVNKHYGILSIKEFEKLASESGIKPTALYVFLESEK